MVLRYDIPPFIPEAAPRPPELRAVRQKTKERPATLRFERMLSLEDLQKHLTLLLTSRRVQGEEATNIREACDNVFGCDPWKYEPVLIDELFSERRNENNPEKIREIRGLIRAGSWMSYPRTTEKMALDDLAAIHRTETQDWHERIRHADPDTAKELTENRNELLAELAEINRAITEKTTGETLEPAARTIENLLGHQWYTMKKMMAANGLDWKTAQNHHLTATHIKEIEKLRALRDFIYYRLLYPTWAKE